MPKQKQKYQDGLYIFPKNHGLMDRLLTAYLVDIILKQAREIDPLTLQNLSSELGIERNRITRVMNTLGIRDDYEDIKAQKDAQ